MTGKKRFLFYFAQELLDFRYREIESLAKLFNVELELSEKEKDSQKPFCVFKMNECEAKKIASRSVMLRFVTELWTSGSSYKEFHDKLRKYEFDEKYKTESFKFRVETYNKNLKHKEKVQKIETMSYMAFQGPIILTNPTNEFIYLEYYGLDPNNISFEPEEIFLGRLVAEGSRDLISAISLKNRKFIGNTSMAPELSLLMANQALCDKNHLAFDPFCGTGSMLIAAAMFGSYVIGSDIDYLMLHGKTRPSRITQKVREKGESVKANMQQYSLSHLFLDVFVGDFSICPFVSSIQFDSIICDRE
jgi:tRNA (guanine10-N2)-methyltransferase